MLAIPERFLQILYFEEEVYYFFMLPMNLQIDFEKPFMYWLTEKKYN